MEDNYSFDVEDDIQVGENHIDIVNRIQSSTKSEVYKVSIGDIGHNNYGLLKVIKNNNNELRNTINFHANDDSNYMVEMIARGKDGDKKILLLKFYDKGSISKSIKKHTLSDKEKDALIHNVLEIGCHLHKDNYIHADIKPDNFFIDDTNKVRLGDLEFLQQLEDIHHDQINKVCGTKGFKYSQGASYDMQDEIFAYIATIYFIETGKVLLSHEELSELDLEDEIVDSINTFVIKRINSLTYIPLKDFLLHTLDDIEEEEPIDCCVLLDRFNDLPPRVKIDTPRPDDEEFDEPKKLKVIITKIWNTHKNPIRVITPLVIVGLGILLYPNPSLVTPNDHTIDDQNYSTSTIISHKPTSNMRDTEAPNEQPADDAPVIEDQKPKISPTAETESIISPHKPKITISSETETLPTIQPIQIIQQEENTQKPNIVQGEVSSLAKRIASLSTNIPIDVNILNVDITENVKLGSTLKIKISPQNARGYLQLLLIDPNDTQTFVFKSARYIKNDETTSLSIKTSKPSGSHYILVIFTAKKYNFTLDNYRQTIKNFNNQSFGMEYVNLYPINVFK